MADFIPNKKETTDFNKGVQYQNGDGVQAQTINNLIESQLYTQSLATNTPNSSEANNVGTPLVEIEVVDGTPRLVFKNLKGEQGIQGEAGNSLRLVETSVNLLAQISEWTNFSISNIINSQGLKIGDILLDDKYVDLDGKSYLGIWEISNIDLNSNTVLIYGRGYILIGNDKSAITSQKQVDTSVAYVKNVPSTSAPYAQINKIGGMSYKDGNILRDAKVTEVKSVGVNLFKPIYSFGSYYNANGITLTVNADNTVTINGTATANTYITFATLTFLPNTTYFISKVLNQKADIYIGNPYKPSGTPISFDSVTTCDLTLFIPATTSFSNEIIYPMINKGETALPYTPYTEHTLVIPESVQSLEGYGQSNPDNAEEYNYIDLKNQKFISFGYISNSVWVSRYSTTDIDISSIIGVEVGGTLIFENKYGYNVPYEVEFYLNSNERLSAKEFVGDLLGTARNAQRAKYADVANDVTGTLATRLGAIETDLPTKVNRSDLDSIFNTYMERYMNQYILSKGY